MNRYSVTDGIDSVGSPTGTLTATGASLVSSSMVTDGTVNQAGLILPSSIRATVHSGDFSTE